MNVKRGLLRIWVVLSVAFILLTAAFSYQPISREFTYDYLLDEIPANGEAEIPVRCSQARGILKTDYRMAQGAAQEGLCWYGLKKFRNIFPEYNDLKDGEVVAKLYQAAEVPVKLNVPWWSVASVATFAIGVPLFLLALGSAIYWAVAGFARKSSDVR